MIITMAQVLTYFLILSRLIGVILTAPVFSSRQIFVLAKMAMVIWTAALLIFVVPLPARLPDTNFAFFLALIVELLIGVLIGFTADLMITSIEFAGSIMDTQAGLSVASLLDPSTGRNAALLEQVLKKVAVIIFILIDGHHMVLSALQQSFNVLPVGAPVDMANAGRFVLTFGKDIFKVAVQLSAPILLIVFLVDFGFGILNRVAEQINVFQLGFQVKPIVAILVLLAITPSLVQSILSIMEGVMEKLISVMSSLQLAA